MFGMFKKKAPTGSFILVAVKAALILRATEHENGGVYTPPEMIIPTAQAIAKEMNYELTGNLLKLTESCVMAFLMDQKFIDDLIKRAHQGPLGTLTQKDEAEIDRITKHIF